MKQNRKKNVKPSENVMLILSTVLKKLKLLRIKKIPEVEDHDHYELKKRDKYNDRDSISKKRNMINPTQVKYS